MLLKVLLLAVALVGAQAFECPGDGLYAAGPCLDYFYSCSGGLATQMPCAGGTVFDQSLPGCTFKGDVKDCPVDPTKCPGAGLYAIGNCVDKFWSCTAKGADPVEMPCAPGTYFDETLGVCQLKTQAFGCTCTTVTALVRNNSDFSTLLAALEATGLNVTLDDAFLNGTVFAPTNEAIAAFLTANGLTPEAALSPTGLPILTKVLLTHVVPETYNSTQLTNGLVLPTLNDNQTLTVDLTTAPGSVLIKPLGGEAANVTVPNIPACLMEVHVIDRVLVPSNLA